MLTNFLVFSLQKVFSEKFHSPAFPLHRLCPLACTSIHSLPTSLPSPGAFRSLFMFMLTSLASHARELLHCPALDALSQRPINWRYVNKQHPTSALLASRGDSLPEQAETYQPCSHSKRAPSLLGALFLALYQELCKSVVQPPGLRPYPTPHPVLGLLPMVSTSSPP